MPVQHSMLQSNSVKFWRELKAAVNSAQAIVLSVMKQNINTLNGMCAPIATYTLCAAYEQQVLEITISKFPCKIFLPVVW